MKHSTFSIGLSLYSIANNSLGFLTDLIQDSILVFGNEFIDYNLFSRWQLIPNQNNSVSQETELFWQILSTSMIIAISELKAADGN